MKIIIALSYGHRSEEPGLTNEALAELIKSHSEQADLILVQKEIGRALKKIDTTPHFEVSDHRIENAYLDTKEVLDQMMEFLKNQNFSLEKLEVITVSHTTHKTGLKWLLQKYGITPRKQIYTSTYDPRSHQWWTRSPFHNLPYKIYAGIRYLLKNELKLFKKSKNRPK
jgi:hypothetical protein